MKIVHITETLTGGIETYLRNIARHRKLRPEIRSLRFILPEKPEWLASAEVFSVPTSRSAGQMFGYAIAVANIVKREQPSIVHVHSSIAGALVRVCAILRLIPKGIKIVYCSHGWAFDQRISPIKKIVYAAIERFLSVKSDATICISPYEKRIAEQVGIQGCVCIPNGIDPDCDQASDGGETVQRSRTVLFVGRLDRQKGIDLLLDSYQRIRPSFKLIVVGDEVRGDLAIARPDCVEFKGWLSGSELADLYRTCDALIIPSRWEGFGLVAIEAMARKKAVFASKVGGLADIVRHKETGWLFELEEIDGMLIDIDAFPDDLLRRMGERGREVFEREFTANRMNNEIVKVYTSVWAQ
jgi:glycosyltransferase involved in cell wall biosynthesis